MADPVDWVWLITQLQNGMVIDHGRPNGNLAPGCPHDLLRFPIVDYPIRYLCGRCLGSTTQSIIDPNAAGLSIRGIDYLVEQRTGGRVTHEYAFGGGDVLNGLRKLDFSVGTILVPYTDLHRNTIRRLRECRLDYRWVRLDPDRDTAYAELLVLTWPESGDLTIIEQDVGIHEGVVPGFTACREPWCVHAYPVQGHPVTALGCVRFTAELRVAEPDLMYTAAVMDVDEFGPGHWKRLDVAVERELHRRGYNAHRHEPDVEHFHVY